MKIKKQVTIVEKATYSDRYSLAEELNEIIKSKTDIEEFVNPDNMVFNKLHMAVFIELLKEGEKE